ncbi:hypothetical protein ABID77_003208 [Variovorax sp. PvP013]
MPRYHNLEEYPHAYLQQEALQGDRRGLAVPLGQGTL